MYDYIIAGAGIAGSVLAFFLHNYGKTVLLVDVPNPASASRVAVGIINPVTGQRLAKAWKADILIPFARDFYRSLEAQTGKPLYIEQDILRILHSPEEQTLWRERRSHKEYASLLSDTLSPENLPQEIQAPFGAGWIYGGGRVDIPLLIEAIHALLPHKPVYCDSPIRPADITQSNTCTEWREYTAQRLLFCEGWRGMENPLLSHIPYMPSYGETILIEAVALPEDYILTAGIHIAPIGHHLFRVGATNSWDKWEECPSPEGLKKLTTMLDRILAVPYTIHEHKAGIRPVLKDRFPVAGLHPSFPHIGILNGLGSKGASLGPWVAAQFAAFLEENTPLPPEIDSARFAL